MEKEFAIKPIYELTIAGKNVTQDISAFLSSVEYGNIWKLLVVAKNSFVVSTDYLGELERSALDNGCELKIRFRSNELENGEIHFEFTDLMED